MKKLKLISLALLSLVVFSCNSSKKQETNTPKDLGKDRIEVLDFYGKHRCTSCLNIEDNTKTILEKSYKKEMDLGTVVFKLIQWDLPENEALTDKFQAAGTSLILYRIKDGKEYISDISDFAFKKSSDPVAFEKGFRAQLDAELKKQ